MFNKYNEPAGIYVKTTMDPYVKLDTNTFVLKNIRTFL